MKNARPIRWSGDLIEHLVLFISPSRSYASTLLSGYKMG